ncbi:MAG: hypothetical protein E6Q66_04710 [Pedobacter sp.]|nr:MAG: hypothetical protein E6Q66_04710 [Pedobacter sp.]
MKPKNENLAAPGVAKYTVHFGVYIPEMRKQYTKEALENDPEVCAYLLEIGSGAISQPKTNQKDNI